MKWGIFFDTTAFIKASTKEVLITLVRTLALVVLVVFVFLQDLRGTLIPAVAIPVSVVGTFVFMLLFGFSINMLTLLGLVLAVTLVVDDAIVVVENVKRHLARGAKDIRRATFQGMTEVRAPIIATTLVLLAVFVPVAFIPGMTGRLYNQFALTIAVSVAISALVSLSLSPALCAVLLRPGRSSREGVFFRHFNKAFDTFSDTYAASVRVLVQFWYLAVIVFAGWSDPTTLPITMSTPRHRSTDPPPPATAPGKPSPRWRMWRLRIYPRDSTTNGLISFISRRRPGISPRWCSRFLWSSCSWCWLPCTKAG